MTAMQERRLCAIVHSPICGAPEKAGSAGPGRTWKSCKMLAPEITRAVPLGAVTTFRAVSLAQHVLDAFTAWRNARAALPDPQTGGPRLVLDAGCGSGRTVVRLLEAGFRVFAFDPATAMLEQARTRLERLDPAVATRATLVNAGLDDLPTLLGETRYDAILCHNVLEFVPDPAGAIQL